MAAPEDDKPWQAAVEAAGAAGVGLLLSDQFRETGSGPVEVEVDGRRQSYLGDWMWETQLRGLLQYLRLADEGAPRLLVLPHVKPSTARALRDRGVAYLDLVGNAFLRWDGVHVRLTGERTAVPQLKRLVERNDITVANLFSPGRSQVIFALLQWPHLVGGPAREVARVAGVSLGLVHGTLKALQQDGFLRRRADEPWINEDHLDRVDELIDVWAAAFPTGLWRRIHQRDYRSDLESWAQTEPGIVVGGEIAVRELVVPASVTVYLDGPLEVKTRQRHRIAAPGETPPNTYVCRRFWWTPKSASAAGDGTPPWLLTYAELAARTDPRLREAAKELRRRARG